eukprot:3282288-Pyramimonas_sp.AAC.1
MAPDTSTSPKIASSDLDDGRAGARWCPTQLSVLLCGAGLPGAVSRTTRICSRQAAQTRLQDAPRWPQEGSNYLSPHSKATPKRPTSINNQNNINSLGLLAFSLPMGSLGFRMAPRGP